MKDSSLIIAYIGTPESYFTKLFLPKLQQIGNKQLKYICAKQNEFTISPTKASLFLKIVFQLKKIKHFLQELSSIIYWSLYCHQNQIQFQFTKNINSPEVETNLKDCDFVLSAGLRVKLTPEILNAPNNGIINFHYSLLPKYRGTNPVFWQKVKRDPKFGYTFHLMNENIDCGEILLQNQVSLETTLPVPRICDLLTLHASNQLFQFLNNPQRTQQQSDIQSSEYTNKDYFNYININTNDHGSVWFEKCSSTGLFILNERWIVQLENTTIAGTTNKLSLTGAFNKDGYNFRFKKINYRPPVFYYFALRNYFE